MKISEIFLSLQGEGLTRGTPSIFIRLPGCNLTCGIQSSICDASKAEWICDSYKVWKETTQDLTNEQLYSTIFRLVTRDDLINNRVHIVWTGGEPFIPHNANAILSFYRFLEQTDFAVYSHMFSEIETNGTIFNSDLLNEINLINCSPKLSNSGIQKDIRINPEFLRTKRNVVYKFVVTRKEQWDEIESDFLPYIYERCKVVLMPGMDHIGDDTMKISQEIWDLAVEKKVLFTTREHIHVWNKLTGV